MDIERRVLSDADSSWPRTMPRVMKERPAVVVQLPLVNKAWDISRSDPL